ncbi:Uncharacterized protein MCB1EB_1634 [Mycoavidus cysteinexigens]|uniref:Uncharacterized protein n=1 Tax=Mycoavidus cysteinexigens TaxID=1553431 RepID=A0A2Z6EXG3_9BURK|nr:collagen-like protein [Mycoavidus cysteinexigens]BBE09795.1 Uncharacterized protein MCB1EB_1634 [Mycoavidus cysteinexigens]GAM53861.1 phage tail fiber protein [bacterium endosymbiont of Mortierella elongata FMR23-6]GLR01696.1 hypothetical protein GCM10007934_15080 [Mycoavidus cysteinexigens]
MSQPRPYHRKKNFLNNNPDRTDHGALNAELDAVSQTLSDVRANAALLQEDDGSLKAQTVGARHLMPEALAALAAAGLQGEPGQPGPKGDKGEVGPRGEVGPSFEAKVRALESERTNYGANPEGFSFLAIDTGRLYFKLSDECDDWSEAFEFSRGPKGNKGDKGAQGIQGLRGPKGDKGECGESGVQGPTGRVDYARVILNDLDTDQSLQGGLAARTISGAISAAAPRYDFSGANIRLRPNNTRLRVDDGRDSAALVDLEVGRLHTAGTGAANTGVKIATGADIGTLFDPAGSAASKLASVDPSKHTVSIAGKSTLTLSLSVVNNQVILKVEAA